MKIRAIIGGGILAGLLVAVFLSTAGQFLGLDLPPWSWSSMATGYLAAAMTWARSTILLMPFAIGFALVNALVCAAVFEFVIRRAAPLPGALVGTAFGCVCAAGLGLVPAAALSLTYPYMPPRAPLGPHDAAWVLAALLAAGALAGLMAALVYGAPRHGPPEHKRAAWRELDSESQT